MALNVLKSVACFVRPSPLNTTLMLFLDWSRRILTVQPPANAKASRPVLRLHPASMATNCCGLTLTCQAHRLITEVSGSVDVPIQ